MASFKTLLSGSESLESASLQDIAKYCYESELLLQRAEHLDEDIRVLRKDISRNGLDRIGARTINSLTKEVNAIEEEVSETSSPTPLAPLALEHFQDARPYAYATEAFEALDIAMEANKFVLGLIAIVALVGIVALIWKLIEMYGSKKTVSESITKEVKDSSKKAAEVVKKVKPSTLDELSKEIIAEYRTIESDPNAKIKHTWLNQAKGHAMKAVIFDELGIETFDSGTKTLYEDVQEVFSVSYKFIIAAVPSISEAVDKFSEHLRSEGMGGNSLLRKRLLADGKNKYLELLENTPVHRVEDPEGYLSLVKDERKELPDLEPLIKTLHSNLSPSDAAFDIFMDVGNHLSIAESLDKKIDLRNKGIDIVKPHDVKKVSAISKRLEKSVDGIPGKDIEYVKGFFAEVARVNKIVKDASDFVSKCTNIAVKNIACAIAFKEFLVKIDDTIVLLKNKSE